MTGRFPDLDGWENAAAARLSVMAGDYYAGGARDEATLRANRSSWADWWLVHRILAGSPAPDLRSTFAGLPLRAPIVAAPTAFHGLAHPAGERETARGVAAAGAAMVLSTLSNEPVEAVVEAAGGAVAFQLYVYKDRGATRAIVDRVRAAGCKALVLTADAAILGTRHRDVRNGFHLPAGLSLPNAAPDGRALGTGDGSALAAYVSGQLDAGLGWPELEQLVATAGLPVWVKGVIHPDDARRAVGMGVAGLVVSNHGGRQLDHGVPTSHALRSIADAVNGAVPVWIDGGIRRGTDIAVALALGANGVLVGRPVLWGLAVDGATGVAEVLDTLSFELREALALLGATRASAVPRDAVTRAY
jgi:4-hydroxymandelate oxidase